MTLYEARWRTAVDFTPVFPKPVYDFPAYLNEIIQAS